MFCLLHLRLIARARGNAHYIRDICRRVIQ